MTERKREKLILKRVENYNKMCPLCREKSNESVLPFGDDLFYCENADCDCLRHSNVGYYVFTDDSILAPNVELVMPDSYCKRIKLKKSI